MSTLALQKASTFALRSFKHLCLAVIILLAAMLLAVMVGEVPISPDIVYRTLSNKLFGTSYAVDLIDAGILWEYRFSRAVFATCCGAALAVCGVIL